MFVLFCIAIATLLLFVLLRKNHIHVDFPEPPGHPLLGHLQDVNSPETILKDCQKFWPHGKNVRLRLGPRWASARVITLSCDSKLFEQILGCNDVTNIWKSENYFYLKRWLNNGLLVSTGNYWRRHRKILTPAFHFGILKDFVETFESVGNVFIDKLKKFDGCPNLDLQPLTTLCTLDIICETAMGTKIHAQDGQNTEYVNSVKEMCRIVIARCLSLLKLFRSTYWMTKDYYIEKKKLKVLHEFTSNVIQSKEFEENSKTSNTKKAFLDLLLTFSDDEGQKLTKQEVEEETNTFMFEGHDTTSSAICFILYCLAEHQDVQEKVLEEQKFLFGDNKNPIITYTELQKMKYLEHVIKEVLRLYPSVPFLGKYFIKPFKTDYCILPKGLNVLLSVYHLHRDPEIFPNPEKFDPSRFETFDSSNPYSYIPFSAGPRNCIGQKFAMLELKSIVSKVIRHFELQPANPKHNLELAVLAVLKSVNGVKLGLKLR